MHVPSHFHSPLLYVTVFGLLCDLTWLEQVCVGMVKALWWHSDEPSVTCVCVWVCEQGTWQTHCLETVGNRATCHLLHSPLSLTPSRRSGNVMREDIRCAVTQIHVHRQLMLPFITISEEKNTTKTGWEFLEIWFHSLFIIGHPTPKQLEDIRFRAHGKIAGMWIMPGRHFEDRSHVQERRVTWFLLFFKNKNYIWWLKFTPWHIWFTKKYNPISKM